MRHASEVGETASRSELVDGLVGCKGGSDTSSSSPEQAQDRQAHHEVSRAKTAASGAVKGYEQVKAGLKQGSALLADRTSSSVLAASVKGGEHSSVESGGSALEGKVSGKQRSLDISKCATEVALPVTSQPLAIHAAMGATGKGKRVVTDAAKSISRGERSSECDKEDSTAFSVGSEAVKGTAELPPCRAAVAVGSGVDTKVTNDPVDVAGGLENVQVSSSGNGTPPKRIASAKNMSKNTIVSCDSENRGPKEHTVQMSKTTAVRTRNSGSPVVVGSKADHKTRGRSGDKGDTVWLRQRARTAVPSAISTPSYKRILDGTRDERWGFVTYDNIIDNSAISEGFRQRHSVTPGGRPDLSVQPVMVVPDCNSNNFDFPRDVDGASVSDRSVVTRPVSPHHLVGGTGARTPLYQCNVTHEAVTDNGSMNKWPTAEPSEVPTAQKAQSSGLVSSLNEAIKITGTSGHTPQWSTPPSYDFVTTLEIYVDTCLGLRESDRKCRQDFVARLQSITTKSLGPRARLQIHGSITTDLALPSSDIDILVTDYDPLSPLQAIQQLSKAIESITAEEMEALSAKRSGETPVEAEDKHKSGQSSDLVENAVVTVTEKIVVDASEVDENMLASNADTGEPDCIARVEEEEAEYRLQIERDYVLSTRVGPNAAAVGLHSYITPMMSQQLPQFPPLGRRRLYVPTVDGPLYQVQTIISTRVPVIKVVEKMTGFRCDITFAGGEHWQSMQLTNQLLKRYPVSRGLILFLKHCVHQMGIGDSQPGDMTSFAIYLLVLHFFNELTRHLDLLARGQGRRQQQQKMEEEATLNARHIADSASRSTGGAGSSPCTPSSRTNASPGTHSGSRVPSPADATSTFSDDAFPMLENMLIQRFYTRQQQQSHQNGSDGRGTVEEILQSILAFMDEGKLRSGLKGGDKRTGTRGVLPLGHSAEGGIDTDATLRQQHHAGPTDALVAVSSDCVAVRSHSDSEEVARIIENHNSVSSACCSTVATADNGAAGGLHSPQDVVKSSSSASPVAVGGELANGDSPSDAGGDEGKLGATPVGRGTPNSEEIVEAEEEAKTRLASKEEEEDAYRSEVTQVLSESPLGHLFHDFCFYYGFAFNYDNHGLQFHPDGSSTIVPKPQQCKRRGQHLYMTSPFDEQYDITARMMQTRAFQELCCMFVPLTNPMVLHSGDRSSVCTLRQALEWISPDTAQRELAEVHIAIQQRRCNEMAIGGPQKTEEQKFMAPSRLSDGDRGAGPTSPSRHEVVGVGEPSDLAVGPSLPPGCGNESTPGNCPQWQRDPAYIPKGGDSSGAEHGSHGVQDGVFAGVGLSTSVKTPAPDDAHRNEMKGNPPHPLGNRQGRRSESNSVDLTTDGRVAFACAASPASEVSSLAVETEVNSMPASSFPCAPQLSGSRGSKGGSAGGSVTSANCDPSYMASSAAHASVLQMQQQQQQQQLQFGINGSLQMFMFPSANVSSMYPEPPQYYNFLPYTTEAQLQYRPNPYQQQHLVPFPYLGYEVSQIYQQRAANETKSDKNSGGSAGTTSTKRQGGGYAPQLVGHSQLCSRPPTSSTTGGRNRGRNYRGTNSSNNSNNCGEKVEQCKVGVDETFDEQTGTPAMPSTGAAEVEGPPIFVGTSNVSVSKDAALGKDQMPQCSISHTKERSRGEGSCPGSDDLNYSHHHHHQMQPQVGHFHNHQGSALQHHQHHIQNSGKNRGLSQQQSQGALWRHQRCTMMMLPSHPYPFMNGLEVTNATSLCPAAQGSTSMQAQQQVAVGGPFFQPTQQGTAGSPSYSLNGSIAMPDYSKMGNTMTDVRQSFTTHPVHHHFHHHHLHLHHHQRWQPPLVQQQSMEESTAAVVGAKGGAQMWAVTNQPGDVERDEFVAERVPQPYVGQADTAQ